MASAWPHIRHGLRVGALFAAFHLVSVWLQATALQPRRVEWAREPTVTLMLFAFAAVGGTAYSALRPRLGRVRAGALGGAFAGALAPLLALAAGGPAPGAPPLPVLGGLGAAIGALAGTVYAILFGRRAGGGPAAGRGAA